MGTILVKNANRMMTSVNALKEGIEILFADGRRGLIPLDAIPEIKGFSNLAHIELPNPYEIVLVNSKGDRVSLPWDFARHYCDPLYRPAVEARALKGRKVLGQRIRNLRAAVGMTQESLATAAKIGRVTLVRIENGEQTPKYDTLLSLALALRRPLQDLVSDEGA